MDELLRGLFNYIEETDSTFEEEYRRDYIEKLIDKTVEKQLNATRDKIEWKVSGQLATKMGDRNRAYECEMKVQELDEELIHLDKCIEVLDEMLG